MLQFNKNKRSNIWVSDNYSVSGTVLTIPHPLTIPSIRRSKCEMGIVCITADLGFAVGDIIFSPLYRPTANTYYVPLTPILGPSNIVIGIDRIKFAGWRKDTGVFSELTLLKWQIFARVTY